MVMVEKTDMTVEMDQADKTVQVERLKTLPAADGFHMPGEFEPHKGTIMIWPERPGSWAYGAKDARKAFAKIAEAIAEGEDVYMLAGPSALASAKAAFSGKPEKIHILPIETDDAWARDVRNRQFNTEMQNDSKSDNLQKRSRFYQGLLDTPILKSGKKTKYRHLPSTIIIFITQEDIFSRDLAMYTFTEQCEEIAGLHLDDGTKKIFLNMTSRRGRPDLVSLLQYMKNTTLDNPEILVKDKRIIKLDRIVKEVKQSEEWEAVKMNILEIGIEKGKNEGIDRVNHLIRLLAERNRTEDIIKAAKDHDYQQNLFKEFGL